MLFRPERKAGVSILSGGCVNWHTFLLLKATIIDLYPISHNCCVVTKNSYVKKQLRKNP
jgi:hypothetical protein